MSRFVLFAALALLAACATATPYQASQTQGGYGYTEQALEANRVRVSFRGNSLTDRETVETYLLYRAAEATVERGFDYFVVAERATDSHTTAYRDPEPFYPGFWPDYWFYGPRFGWRPYYDPFFAGGFWADPGSYREVTRYVASAEISMFHGRKPANDAKAYDAHEVVNNLRARVTTPPASG